MRQKFSLFEGIFLREDRIVVPSGLKERILKLAHETRLGIVKIKQLLRPKFHWVAMDKDIEHFVRDCSEICAVNQPLNANVSLELVQLPDRPWKKGAVDIVGPIEDKL